MMHSVPRLLECRLAVRHELVGSNPADSNQREPALMHTHALSAQTQSSKEAHEDDNT